MNDQSTTDRQLLREFIQTRSDTAFAEIVHRHVNWIYAVARRQVGESAADDLTQAVFLVLFQKAAIAARQSVLSAWLFGVLRFAILRYRRDQKRRAQHERRAAQMHTARQIQTSDSVNLELLDELLIKLREKDRHAILVRFYEQRTLAEVAEALGISEEAAAKRVTRAIEKLRFMLAHRGISATPTILTTTLMQQLATHAPPSTISAAANASHTQSTTTATQLSKGAIRMMALRHIGITAGASLALCLAIGAAAAGYAHSQSPPRNSPAALIRAPQVNTLQSRHIFVAISPDGRVSAYSNTLGKWSPLQLPADAAAEMKRRAQANQLDGFIASDDVVVFTIHGNVYGYSTFLGKWTALPLDADAKAAVAAGAAINPVVSSNIAAVSIGNRAYAYSPITGTWDGLLIDVDAGDFAITAQDMAEINYGDHLAIFSVHTGKWATVDWGNGKS